MLVCWTSGDEGQVERLFKGSDIYRQNEGLQQKWDTFTAAMVRSASNYVEMLTSLAPELKQCEAGHLQSTKLPQLRTMICLDEEVYPGMYRWSEVMAQGDTVTAEPLAERQLEQEFDDAINIQYTNKIVQQTFISVR
jgi:fatty-acyl-CoA synthase